ncbi:YcnI family protein [Stigmatella sp. ncwal1]|uniref:YcnI family protein n=1 Tax=Stigmatella ashevillensis TaxID=2995309 RepID=A0ABT5DFT8_9BACT|nr:YcnI family protein [Stigmatella ashevillena]MDC0711939.1 YcnI family protein [Stigmatella ashevillena]
MTASPRLLLAAVAALLCTAAEAHVSVLSGPVIAGNNQELTFNVPHGCSGADTFRIEVRIPAGVTSVRPLDSMFGKAVLSKDAEGVLKSVVWTKPAADVLPGDTHLYRVSLSALLPSTPFTTLFFPTIQSCRAADGTESVVEWTAASTDHDHGGGTPPTTNPAPFVFLLPARSPGWNKYTVDQHVHDLSVFKDAQIVWTGNTAYSANPLVLSLIEKEQGTQVLKEIHPGTEIWVKY